MYSKMDFLDPIKKMEKCKYCTLLASFDQILNILCDLRKTLYIVNFMHVCNFTMNTFVNKKWLSDFVKPANIQYNHLSEAKLHFL